MKEQLLISSTINVVLFLSKAAVFKYYEYTDKVGQTSVTQATDNTRHPHCDVTHGFGFPVWKTLPFFLIMLLFLFIFYLFMYFFLEVGNPV